MAWSVTAKGCGKAMLGVFTQHWLYRCCWGVTWETKTGDSACALSMSRVIILESSGLLEQVMCDFSYCCRSLAPVHQWNKRLFDLSVSVSVCLSLSCLSVFCRSLSLARTDLQKSRLVLKSLSLCNKVLSSLSLSLYLSLSLSLSA